MEWGVQSCVLSSPPPPLPSRTHTHTGFTSTTMPAASGTGASATTMLSRTISCTGRTCHLLLCPHPAAWTQTRAFQVRGAVALSPRMDVCVEQAEAAGTGVDGHTHAHMHSNTGLSSPCFCQLLAPPCVQLLKSG